MNRDEIVKNLQAAKTFVGQAQELAPNSSPLWKEMGQLFDSLDDLQSAVQCNEFDDEGREN